MTKQAPTYPVCFTGMNLDQVNYMLKQGIANEADAVSMVKWWNESGKRFTRASLHKIAVTLGSCNCLAPQIRITD